MPAQFSIECIEFTLQAEGLLFAPASPTQRSEGQAAGQGWRGAPAERTPHLQAASPEQVGEGSSLCRVHGQTHPSPSQHHQCRRQHGSPGSRDELPAERDGVAQPLRPRWLGSPERRAFLCCVQGTRSSFGNHRYLNTQQRAQDKSPKGVNPPAAQQGDSFR